MFLSLKCSKTLLFQGPKSDQKRSQPTTVLKITAGQWSLTVATVFVTAKNLHRTVIMTTNTKMRQQLLTTTKTIFTTSFKIILVILCHRQVKQTKSMMECCTGN